MSKKGKLIVITGPSAVGKDSIVSNYINKNGGKLMISATSRKPREGEENNKDYYFLTEKEFEDRIEKNLFLEYAKYNGNYYGTPKDKIDELLEKGENVFLIIEVVGALNVKKLINDSILIFILPPSHEELERRIRTRAIDSEEDIIRRLEIAEKEIAQKDKFDHILVNETIEDVVKEIENILN